MKSLIQLADAEQDCLTFRIWDPFGRRLDITSSEILLLLRQPGNAVFLALAIAAFIAVDAMTLRDQVSFAATVVIWTLVVPLHMVVYTLIDFAWAWGQRHIGLGRIYLPLLGMLAYGIDFLLVTALLALFSGQTFSAALDPNLALVGYPLALIFEMFFFAFVNPILLQDMRAAETALGEDDAARQITAGGESFALADLLLLKSQEHHVQIVTDDGARRVRARLIDLVDQTDPGDGVMAHRSHWVAGRAIRDLDAGVGTAPDTLLLVDGSRLPVARPRRAAVRAWIAQHRADLAPIRG